MNAAAQQCPLCLESSGSYFQRDKHREYWCCDNCDLVYVPTSFHLSEADEEAHYGTHENDPNDERYRGFLNKLVAPIAERLSPASSGLDFGCGPGPTVSLMLEELGHSVRCYDKYFLPDTAVLNEQYDFITSTEVIEHLANPHVVFEQFATMLRSQGMLGIMTRLQPPPEQFASWHYKNDPTHICFYSVETFNWIAGHWQYSLDILGADVILLKSLN